MTTQASTLTLTPIRETGWARMGTIAATYADVLAKLGEPNVTDMDDSYKVKASWGFRDDAGRKAFVWCYKYDDPAECEHWSADGDIGLLREIFGSAVR